MKKNNPNGANQYKVDPRQALFLSYFFNQKSETFSNGLQSALKAGFEPEYAKVLVSHMPTWLSEKVNSYKIIQKAETNLDSFLSPEEEDKKIRADMTKFALERLYKEKYGKNLDVTTKGEKLTLTAILTAIEDDTRPEDQEQDMESDTSISDNQQES